VPDAGDIVWVNFNPHGGREQASHRPALVLSPIDYNNKTSLMLCCPMTTQIKNSRLKFPLPLKVPSVIVADQITSVIGAFGRLNEKARFRRMNWQIFARRFAR
jgi:mRNA interferase MazF